MAHELRSVESADERQAMHDIRRATLFAPGRHSPTVVYDDNHADDHKPGNQCFLLMLERRAIGVARLDHWSAVAGVVRLVAIVPDMQGKGHGRAMDGLLESAARARGMSHLFVNAAPTATGYYEKTGWRKFVWDPAELTGIAERCVQMRKDL